MAIALDIIFSIRALGKSQICSSQKQTSFDMRNTHFTVPVLCVLGPEPELLEEPGFSDRVRARFGLEVDKNSGLIWARDVLFVLGAQKYQNSLATLLNF